MNLKINLILRSVTATNSALAPDDKEILLPFLEAKVGIKSIKSIRVASHLFTSSLAGMIYR